MRPNLTNKFTTRSNQAKLTLLKYLFPFGIAIVMSACGGGSSSSSEQTPTPSPQQPPEPTPVSTSLLSDKATAQRFMAFAGFGATDAQLEAMIGTDATDWLTQQFAMPYQSYLERVLPKLEVEQPETRNSTASTQRYQLEMFWDAAIAGQDPLRQRMLFALSQIVVANDNNRKNAHREAYYLDQLGRNAFGNYQDILLDITYTPLMGRYLTYLNNRKGDPVSGRLPDENYAREILQLFSIGLVELNMDGSLKTESGSPDAGIETYDNDDIINLARVFTGLTFDPAQRGIGAYYHPMVMIDERHSTLEKHFLNTQIPAQTDGATSIQLAIEGIFNHPNVAPFMARQLIQRFTTSHPSPAYIERVASAFETGQFIADNGVSFGSASRGDLTATLAAILLEPSLFLPTSEATTSAGKVREPVLRFIHWARAFSLSNVNSAAETQLRATDSPSKSLGQRPFGSPSVFNFYRPGYIAPSTQSGELGLTAPEFQVVNTGSAIGFVNFMTAYITNNTRTTSDTDTFVPNYSQELLLASDPPALVEHLSMLLTGGRMTDDTKLQIQQAIESIGVRSTDQQADLLARVELGIIMAVSAPSFTVIY